MRRLRVIVIFTHYYCLKKQFWTENKIDEQTKFMTIVVATTIMANRSNE